MVLMLITFAGSEIENSFTLFMFSLYFLSFFNWCVGSLIPPNEEQKLKGMTGYSCKLSFINFYKKKKQFGVVFKTDLFFLYF